MQKFPLRPTFRGQCWACSISRQGHVSGVQAGRIHKAGRIAIEAEQLWLDEVTGWLVGVLGRGSRGGGLRGGCPVQKFPLRPTFRGQCWACSISRQGHVSWVQARCIHKAGRIAIETEQLRLDEVTGRPGIDLLGWLPM